MCACVVCVCVCSTTYDTTPSTGFKKASQRPLFSAVPSKAAGEQVTNAPGAEGAAFATQKPAEQFIFHPGRPRNLAIVIRR